MKRDYFIALERRSNNETVSLSEVIEQLAFNDQGLIPVIVQDAGNKSVLMFAWMNQDALNKTIKTKRMTYWSRSRKQLWVKGETSGHMQTLTEMSFDCDGDVILCLVEQQGAACHTGRPSCFYLKVEGQIQQVRIIGNKRS